VNLAAYGIKVPRTLLLELLEKKLLFIVGKSDKDPLTKDSRFKYRLGYFPPLKLTFGDAHGHVLSEAHLRCGKLGNAYGLSCLMMAPDTFYK
jgi:hypothetical protein